MNHFEFYNPVRIVFGAGEVSRIGELASLLGKRALIVSYNQVDFYGDLFERIHARLEAFGMRYMDCFTAASHNWAVQAPI